ncbi:MAG: 5-(carboxyamino)imidazole ribonucleotide mutase [Treponema sp.]|jgi:5-(carboxyamino)imidazole ribonucleotide mutase|nr:5-(carboxyamino)imidazole ribonucleotide mutase [Treponema sp.]
MKVAIIFGSLSDKPVMKKAAEVLRSFGVDFSAQVISAHRTPQLLKETIEHLEAGGCELIIAGAGLAAHLPGVVASLTALPVIGVPIASGGLGGLGGLDALFSIVQMPGPIPVAAVGVNNAANAAYLAVEILSLKYPKLKEGLSAFRNTMKADFTRENQLPDDWFMDL